MPTRRSKLWVVLDARRAHAMRDERQRRLGLIGDRHRILQRLPPARNSRAIAGKNCRHWLAGFHPITGTRRDDEAHSWVGHVFDLRAPAAHLDDSAADRTRLDPRDETSSRRGE